MKSYKIVIIEDEELIREELKTLLVNAGYVVDCVINFAKTIEKSNTKNFTPKYNDKVNFDF